MLLLIIILIIAISKTVDIISHPRSHSRPNVVLPISHDHNRVQMCCRLFTDHIRCVALGTSYKFRVVAVNVIGASPPSAPSKLYTVVGSGRTNERPIDGPYITYNEAINETTIILKWTVSESKPRWREEEKAR